MTTTDDRTLERPGTSLVYSVRGSGPPVVFGHSLFCQRSMWQPVIDRVESRFTCINVGLRGHGESTATKPFSIWDLADDWIAILDAEGIERATLAGLSTGGMTAMRLALEAPERVAALALFDTDAGAETRLLNRVQYDALGLLYRKTGIIPKRTLVKNMFCDNTRTSRPDLVRDLIALMARHDRHQLGHAMKAIFGRKPIDLTPIEAPTLVCVGEHDQATPPSRAKYIAEQIRGARLEIIADAGHLSALEQPDRVADLLTKAAELDVTSVQAER